MNEGEKNRYEALAAADPGKFLHQVAGNSALTDIEIILHGKIKRPRLKRTWAVNSAHDGLKVLFNRHATDERQSLRRALRSFTRESSHKFTKPEKVLTGGGKTITISPVDGDKVTPAALIESITDAVRVTRALAERRQDFKWLLEQCDFCEQVILPLLQKIPPDKSMAQYASPPRQKKPT